MIKLVVSDFDGVLTDNSVYLDQNGTETVRCHRGDGHGISLLRQKGIPFVVLSKERNPVVSKRCDKLGVACYQGIDNKLPLLEKIIADHGVTAANVMYIGNDINDNECLGYVGHPVAVADAHATTKLLARYVTTNNGGYGAVREAIDTIVMGDDSIRPWGHYSILHDTDYCKVKELFVKPNSKLSYQSHEHRDEAWTVVQGQATVTLDDQVEKYSAGETVIIKAGTKHRLANEDNTDLKVIEVQTGTYFGEDDIVRYEDDYGRS